MVLSRLKDSQNGFHFTKDRLPRQKKMIFYRRLLFHSFAFLSILGFSLKPLAAQTGKEQQAQSGQQSPKLRATNEQKAQVMPNDAPVLKKKKEIKDQRNKKKRKYRTIICPAF